MKRFAMLLFVAVMMTGFSAMALNYTLTMQATTGGTTTPVSPGTYSYAKGTNVTLTAQAAPGWSFVNWTGSTTTTSNPYTFKMSSNKTFRANFVQSMYSLTVNVQGSGTTTPSGTTQYAPGTVVTLTGTPSGGISGNVFNYWKGAEINGSFANPAQVTMTGNKTVTAVFTDPNSALKDFIGKPDSNYAWSQYLSQIEFGYTNYFIDMTSQQWLNASLVDRPIWQHYLIIQVGWFAGGTAVILIDGGSNGGTPPTTADSAIGLMSLMTGFPIADLKQVPNEPLYFTDEVGVRRSEDDILAYSFDKYMVTGDPNWNGHLPMAKAGIRGMDTIHAKLSSVNQFLVVGASKRGWTTWLVAASDDPRIIGYCPIVIPILNVEAQMDHHWESYGFYAPAVDPYAAFDLFCRIKVPPADDWKQIEDPYEYFGESTVIANKPKLLVNASGDQFFCTDSLRFYWNDIPGPGAKHVRVMPNASHGMEEGTSFDDALATFSSWASNVKNGAANKPYSWVVNPDNSITMTCGQTPSSVVLWQATNPNGRDFRYELIGGVWTSSPLYDQGGNTYVGYCPPPAQGWTAYFVQADFGNDEIYTTQVVINPDVLPFEGTHCL